MKVFRTFLLTLLALLGVSLTWRWLSQRHSLPCPTWLSGLVKGPVMDRILGTQATLGMKTAWLTKRKLKGH